jgi:hypothetical protein
MDDSNPFAEILERLTRIEVAVAGIGHKVVLPLKTTRRWSRTILSSSRTTLRLTSNLP